LRRFFGAALLAACTTISGAADAECARQNFTIRFAQGSAALSAAGRESAGRIAHALMGCPTRIYVVGHNNANESDAVSQRRAQQIAGALAGYGIARGNLQADGAGFSEPLGDSDADNRVVVVQAGDEPAMYRNSPHVPSAPPPVETIAKASPPLATPPSPPPTRIVQAAPPAPPPAPPASQPHARAVVHGTPAPAQPSKPSGYGAWLSGWWQTATSWWSKPAPKPLTRAEAEAALKQGRAYDTGEGVARDRAKAAELYRRAADAGNTTAMFYMGVFSGNGIAMKKDTAQAAQWYRKAAAGGVSEAMFNLALAYDKGDGVAKDPVQANAWYRKSADAGNRDAMFNLAFDYDHGIGFAKDPGQATAWYRKAAEAGEPEAMYEVALHYDDGNGVAKDPVEAAGWYRKSAEAGNRDAMFNLATDYRTGDGVDKDLAEAVTWYRKGAEAGDATSMYELGLQYDNGHGVAKDKQQAMVWYRKAADAGDHNAMLNLGVDYENGEGVAKDPTMAVQLYRKALGSDDADTRRLAQSNLTKLLDVSVTGDWLLEGEYTDKNNFLSISYVRVRKPRNSRGMVEFDEASFSNDTSGSFGLLFTHVGNCNNYSVADTRSGKVDGVGNADLVHVPFFEFSRQRKGYGLYSALEVACGDRSVQTIPDPIAHAHRYLKV
jgi:uncharacterized protein